jgi:hypothetical protein
MRPLLRLSWATKINWTPSPGWKKPPAAGPFDQTSGSGKGCAPHAFFHVVYIYAPRCAAISQQVDPVFSEFASPADWRFDRIDRNLDGKVSRLEAARLFDRPVGEVLPDEAGECFYVERQVVRVKENVAEEFKKRGYPKADCSLTPEVTDELKTKKFTK